MKKSSFAALVLGTVSGVLFALGMCMALLPEWDAFKPGVVCGAIGIVLALVTIAIWRKMENKPPVKLSGKSVGIIILTVLGALTLGMGMCLCMVWSKYILGIAIGLVGIIALLFLIPVCKGLK